MPSTPKQMRTAGRELSMRRSGEVKQQANRMEATRPFGSASTKTLRAYASWPKPAEQREAARAEQAARGRGETASSGFAKASKGTVEFYASASDAAIRKRNGQG